MPLRAILLLYAVPLFAATWPSERFDAFYYDNTETAGTPVLTREEATINQDWSFAAPGEALPVNGFSARWRGRFAFAEGTWRFRADADDGLRLWVNDRLLIDAWQTPGNDPIEEIIFLPAGEHRLEVTYVDRDGAAHVALDWAPYTTVDGCRALNDSWCAEFFPNRTLAGEGVNTTLDPGTPYLSATAPDGFPGDGFSARFKGLFPFQEGFYTFTTSSRDGVRVWVDGRLLINDWFAQPMTDNTATFFLTEGNHEVRVENFRTWGDDTAGLHWEPDRGARPHNQDAALGANIFALEYWSREWTLLDVARASGGWYTQTPTVWDTGEQDLLDTDEHGWVRSLPGENDPESYRTIALVALNGTRGNYPAGRYLVLYEGQGTLDYGFDASYNENLSRPGRHVLDVDNPGNGGILVTIKAINPADHLRNIRIIRDANLCTETPFSLCEGSCSGEGCRPLEEIYQNQPFHPAFLRDLRGYKVIRYMDMLRTNDSTLSDWAARPRLEDARWNSHNGAPLELVVALTNQTDTDAWINVPTRADDAFVVEMATLLRDSLEPGRQLYVEYSNEIWNTAFSNGSWVEEQAVATWPDVPNSPYTRRINWFGKRSAEVVALFKDVFGSQAHRVHGIMGGFSASSWVGEQALLCPLVTEAGGSPCYTQMEALAIAPYFGGYVGMPRFAEAVAPWFEEADGGLDLLFQELSEGGPLFDPTADPGDQAPADGALADARRFVENNAAVVATYGLKLYAYEGGQHLAGVGTQQSNEALTTLLTAANRDPRMGELYAAYLRQWREAGGSLFCNFLSVGGYGQFGSWGAKEYQQQVGAPKYTALMAFAARYPCWWEGCAPPITNLNPYIPIPFGF